MKKPSPKLSKNKTKQTVKKENLKNVSGGRQRPNLPDGFPEPGKIRVIVDKLNN